MRHLILIFLSILLNLGVLAQGFNEDSLYHAIKSMPNNEDKLEPLKEFITKANNIERVKEYSILCAKLGEKFGKSNYICCGLSTEGWAVAYGEGNTNKALELFFKSLKIADTTGNANQRHQNLIQIASTFFNKKQINFGLDYLQPAIDELHDGSNNDLYCEALNLKGWAYRELKMPNYALDSYFRLHGIAMENHDERIANMAKYGLANCYFEMFKENNDTTMLDFAVIEANKVLEYFNGKDHTYMQVYQTFPCIFLEASKLSNDPAEKEMYMKKAESLCELGLSIVEEKDLHFFEDYILEAKADILLEKGNNSEALRILQKTNIEKTIETYIKYYKATGDYRSQLRLMDLLHKNELVYAGAQTIITSNRVKAQVKYESERKAIDQMIKQRDIEEHMRNKQYEFMQSIMLKLIGVVMLVVLVFTWFLINSWHANKKLNHQNKIIIHKNERLEKLTLEEMAQNEEIERQSRLMQKHTEEIMENNDRLKAGIFYAKHIQDAVITSQEVMDSIFKSCIVYYRPLEIISGDFYWAVKIGNQRLLAVSDCTGHGVPGALLSILGISFLSDISSYRHFGTPNAAAILSAMRSMIIKGIGDECDDGMDMALVVIDDDTRTIHYAGAMRPLYLLRDNEITIYKPDRIPIGRYIVKDKPFTDKTFEYKPNDRLFMFSDGITDVFTEDRSQKFSEKELRRIITEHASCDLQTLKKYLTNYYETQWGESCIIDDQVLVGVEL